MAQPDDDLIDLIAAESLIDREKLTREATLSDLGLDSVDVITIVFAVEEKYQIEVADDVFQNVTTFGGLLDVLTGLIAAK